MDTLGQSSNRNRKVLPEKKFSALSPGQKATLIHWLEVEKITYLKTRYTVVKSKFPLPSRLLLNAAQAVELGEEIAAQKSQITETQKRQQKQRSQAAQFVQRTGIVMPERAHGKIEVDRLRELEDFLKGKDTP